MKVFFRSQLFLTTRSPIGYYYVCVKYTLVYDLISFCLHLPQWHREHEIDTFLIHSNSLVSCGTKVTVDTLVSQLSQKYGFYVLLDRDALPHTTNLSNVLAVFVGDEADAKV